MTTGAAAIALISVLPRSAIWLAATARIATAPKANDRRAAMPKREARGRRLERAAPRAADGRRRANVDGRSFSIGDAPARDPVQADVGSRRAPRNVCGWPNRAQLAAIAARMARQL